MAWRTDSRLYRSVDELLEQLPPALASGPRVLKQCRGNGGNGVWKVALVQEGATPAGATVQVLHAVRSSRVEEMRLGDFIDRCRAYFAGAGGVADQPYQARLGEGMIRCYLVHDRVVGFGHQFVTALLPLPPGSLESPAPPPRVYYGPAQPEFQPLKAKLESGWVADLYSPEDVITLDTAKLNFGMGDVYDGSGVA